MQYLKIVVPYEIWMAVLSEPDFDNIDISGIDAKTINHKPQKEITIKSDDQMDFFKIGEFIGKWYKTLELLRR